METTTISPLVSVAMCTYNGAAFLPVQIDAILQQTYPNLELVIVDDCSTDETWSVLQQYRERDSRIRIIRNEKNLGYNKNFEKAFTLCKGAYIAISDQDDWCEPNKLEEMMRQWPGDAVFVYSLSRDFFGNEPVRGEENKPIRYYEGHMPAKLAFDSPIHGHASMFQRSLLQDAMPFPANVYYDWWLSMIASATGMVSCIKKTFTYHRISGQNSSRALLNIKEKKEKTEKLRQLCITHMETFLSRPFADQQTRSILERYILLLRQKKDNRFSLRLFLFFFRNRSITFHFKRKQNVISLLKNSFKRAFTGL